MQLTDLERENILKSLSSLNFRDKQRDVFANHQQGTGQWLVETKEFQQWFKGQESSTLWCPGIRMSTSPNRFPIIAS
jgi:predicted phosphoadenosine phosphosulfate sulfurtransferase